MKDHWSTFNEQRKALGWSKDCKCHWRVFLNGVVVKGVNPKCQAHDSFFKKLKTYLKPKAVSDR